jgi:hypothetical protein
VPLHSKYVGGFAELTANQRDICLPTNGYALFFMHGFTKNEQANEVHNSRLRAGYTEIG